MSAEHQRLFVSAPLGCQCKPNLLHKRLLDASLVQVFDTGGIDCNDRHSSRRRIESMSDKEAKLAAARKRAEALKAKKAEKKEDAVKADHSEAIDGENTSVVPSEDAKPDEGNTSKADGLEQEIRNLKRLLEENVGNLICLAVI